MIDDDVQAGGWESPTSSSLLTRVKAGEEAAWERFAQLYRPLVLHWCRRDGLQHSDAEDVAQAVFAAVVGKIQTFRHDRAGDTLRGWLRTITRHKVADLHRRSQREPPGVGGSDDPAGLVAPPDTPTASDDGLEADEKRLLLRRAFELVLAGFKEHTRRAFWLVVVENRTPDEVAQVLGVEVHVVYLAKSRVLRRLREEFDGLVDLDRDLGPAAESAAGG